MLKVLKENRELKHENAELKSKVDMLLRSMKDIQLNAKKGLESTNKNIYLSYIRDEADVVCRVVKED